MTVETYPSVRPHLEFGLIIRPRDFEKALENVQNHATKLRDGYKNLDCIERLKRLDLSSVAEKLARAGLIEFYKPLRKIPKFCQISWCGNFWKRIVLAEFWASKPKLCGNYAFPQNLNTKKLG